jgi:hypothetical protein
MFTSANHVTLLPPSPQKSSLDALQVGTRAGENRDPRVETMKRASVHCDLGNQDDDS